MHILVTGGAGYIGSHTVKIIGESGNDTITVIDNLSTGVESAVLYGTLHRFSLEDNDRLEQLFSSHSFDAVIHFAAHIVVPESISLPMKYYRNNTINTAGLIDTAVRHGVKYFIFSSTAAVYGEPNNAIVSEHSPTQPINPYGWSKLMSEQILKDSAAAGDMRYIILRYFNVAGADPEGKIGQNFPDATHLIKVAAQTALGMRSHLNIFGTDFNTPDGTGIRDYIHVSDLAAAHKAALQYLAEGGDSCTLNCGYGKGFSVKEVISAMEQIHGAPIPVVETDRRPGDPAALIADNTAIMSTLDWKPRLNNLHEICRTAYEWEKKISHRQ